MAGRWCQFIDPDRAIFMIVINIYSLRAGDGKFKSHRFE